MKRKLWILFLATILGISLICGGCSNNKVGSNLPDDSSNKIKWTQEYITKVPPIIMKDPFLELLGQIDQPIPYTYEEIAKYSGHSCGAVAGAWTITRKALEALYPNEIPVRGHIKITAPGAEDEWYVGVFGEVMSYITGAAPKTGFPGNEFGEAFNRRNLMIYQDKFSNTPPAEMVWLFERIDTGAKVSVKYNLSKILPPSTPERNKMSGKMARGEATPEEAEDWIKYWNNRAIFVLENADKIDGFFTVKVIK